MNCFINKHHFIQVTKINTGFSCQIMKSVCGEDNKKNFLPMGDIKYCKNIYDVKNFQLECFLRFG